MQQRLRGLRVLALSLLWATAALTTETQKVLSSSDGEKRNPLDSKFEQFALGLLDEWHVPGMSIAVVDGDETWAAVSV